MSEEYMSLSAFPHWYTLDLSVAVIGTSLNRKEINELLAINLECFLLIGIFVLHIAQVNNRITSHSPTILLVVCIARVHQQFILRMATYATFFVSKWRGCDCVMVSWSMSITFNKFLRVVCANWSPALCFPMFVLLPLDNSHFNSWNSFCPIRASFFFFAKC